MKNFEEIDKKIKIHNELYDAGVTSYTRKLQKYSDWNTQDKFKRLCGTRLAKKPRALTNAAMLRQIKSWPKLPNNTEVNHCHFPNPIPGIN